MDTILTLPLVLAVVLVELAVGGTFVSWFLERRGGREFFHLAIDRSASVPDAGDILT